MVNVSFLFRFYPLHWPQHFLYPIGDPVFDNAEKGSGEGEKVPEPEKEGDKEEL